MLLNSLLGIAHSVRYFAATPENPRFNLNDPAAWDALGAEPAASGLRVNENSALKYSPYYRALSLISGAIAKLPLLVYREIDRGREIDADHPAYQLLRWHPNSEMTAFVWKRLMVTHSISVGNGYSYIFRNADGSPRELIPLDPHKTFPVRENGRLWFVTEVAVGSDASNGAQQQQQGDWPLAGAAVATQKRKLPAEDVLHFMGLSYDGLIGISLIEYAREALGMGLGIQRYGSIYFKNSARSSVILKHPLKLDLKTKQELREGWERMHTGLDNAHRTAILDQGLDAKEMNTNAKDAQLVEADKVTWIHVANYFDLPPHKLGNRDATSYNSLEQENQAMLDDCLEPRLIPMEEQFRDKLLTEQQKEEDSHEIQFDRKKLINVNQQARSAYYRTALAGQPWMSVNEVRQEEGLNPSEDEGTDEIPKPLNMGKGGADNAGDPGGSPPGGQEKAETGRQGDKETRRRAWLAQRPLLEATVRRMVGRVAKHGAQLAKAVKSSAEYMAWLARLDETHAGTFAEAFYPFENALEAAGWPSAENRGPSIWLAETLHGEFAALADSCTPAGLPSAAQALAEELEARLPAEAGRIYCGSEGQPRDELGRFAAEEGGESAGDLDERHEKEAEDLEKKHGEEDDAADKAEIKEEEKIGKVREKEDEKLQAKRNAEDDASGRTDRAEDNEADRESDRARDVEDRQIYERRLAEDRAMVARFREEREDRALRQGDEEHALEERHEGEREKMEERHDAQREAREARHERELEELQERHAREMEEMDERHGRASVEGRQALVAAHAAERKALVARHQMERSAQRLQQRGR
jgi:HK97 family phage portal protein